MLFVFFFLLLLMFTSCVRFGIVCRTPQCLSYDRNDVDNDAMYGKRQRRRQFLRNKRKILLFDRRMVRQTYNFVSERHEESMRHEKRPHSHSPLIWAKIYLNSIKSFVCADTKHNEYSGHSPSKG